jgi:hypothetical protein
VAPEYDHLATAMEEATAPICSELRGRLRRAPIDEDWLAMTTAIAKAALEGLRRGADEFSDQVEETLPIGKHVYWQLDLVCNDLWAERFDARR